MAEYGTAWIIEKCSGQVRFYFDYSFDPEGRKVIIDVVTIADDNFRSGHIELTGITRGEKKEATVTLKKKDI